MNEPGPKLKLKSFSQPDTMLVGHAKMFVLNFFINVLMLTNK